LRVKSFSNSKPNAGRSTFERKPEKGKLERNSKQDRTSNIDQLAHCKSSSPMLMSLLNFHKNHHTHPSYLSFLKGSIGMMLNPEGTQSVFEMEDGLLKSESTQELLRFTSKDPTVDAMIKERYLQPVPDTASLGKLPKNTLGYKYFYHLDSMGFDPDYYRKIDVQNDIDYVMMRIRQTHDIWHVVTGFDTHPLGEIAIKAVELSQTHRPMAAAICAGGVFRYMLKEPELFGDCLESIVAGYHRNGKSFGIVTWTICESDWVLSRSGRAVGSCQSTFRRDQLAPLTKKPKRQSPRHSSNSRRQTRKSTTMIKV